MRAIVLVGGEGTRLRPLTWHTPKQLVPILNRPLIKHLLGHLRKHGITQVTLALTRRSDAVRQALGDGSALGVDLDYAYEETPLGSGGAIASIASAGGWDEPFLVCNGDLITDLDITDFITTHRARGAELSLSLYKVADPSAFGVVALEGDSRIARFVEKPPREEAPSNFINAGTWLFEPSVLARMDATHANRVEDVLFPSLAASGGAIHGYLHRGYWRDVGNPETYLRTNIDLAKGKCPALLALLPNEIQSALASGTTLVAQSARIEPSARLRGAVIIGSETELAADAEVRDSVLWDGVVVGAGAVVHDSVLASGVRLGAGAVVKGAIVGHGAVIGDGERLEPGASIEPDAQYAATVSR